MADTHSDSGSSMVAIVALLILAGLAVLFFVYGLPMLQNASNPQTPTEIKLEIPALTPPSSAPVPAPVK